VKCSLYIILKASAYLESITPRGWTNGSDTVKSSRRDYLRVVIHIRRTDLVDGDLQREGWALPRVGYFKDAMDYFRRKCTKVCHAAIV